MITKLVKIIFVASFVFVFSCKNENKTSAEDSDSTVVENHVEKIPDNIPEEKPDSSVMKKTTDKEYTAKYICPNHCKGSGSDKAGDCQVCEMELIENPANQK